MRVLVLALLVTVSSGFALRTPLPITLGTPFTLDAGVYMARLEAAKLNVEFLRVKSDSRCPVNVACVWAGDAALEVRVSQGKVTKTVLLHTTLEPKGVSVFKYRLELRALTPERGVQGETRATFVLTKAKP
jgi:hypothetical protein